MVYVNSSPPRQMVIIENSLTLVVFPLIRGIPNRIGGEEMIKVEEIIAIRCAYFVEGLTMREIARRMHLGWHLVRNAIANARL